MPADDPTASEHNLLFPFWATFLPKRKAKIAFPFGPSASEKRHETSAQPRPGRAEQIFQDLVTVAFSQPFDLTAGFKTPTSARPPDAITRTPV
jgi:hypothetical protein